MKISDKTLPEIVADLARPTVLYVTAFATAFATVQIALDKEHLGEGAVFVTAALGGLAVLYGAKAIEETRKSGHSADVEKAKANAGTTQTQPGTDPAASNGQPVPSATVTTTLSVPGGDAVAGGEVDAAPR